MVYRTYTVPLVASPPLPPPPPPPPRPPPPRPPLRPPSRSTTRNHQTPGVHFPRISCLAQILRCTRIRVYEDFRHGRYTCTGKGRRRRRRCYRRGNLLTFIIVIIVVAENRKAIDSAWPAPRANTFRRRRMITARVITKEEKKNNHRLGLKNERTPLFSYYPAAFHPSADSRVIANAIWIWGFQEAFTIKVSVFFFFYSHGVLVYENLFYTRGALFILFKARTDRTTCAFIRLFFSMFSILYFIFFSSDFFFSSFFQTQIFILPHTSHGALLRSRFYFFYIQTAPRRSRWYFYTSVILRVRFIGGEHYAAVERVVKYYKICGLVPRELLRLTMWTRNKKKRQ